MDENNQSNKETVGEVLNCNECEFQTKVKKHMKGHMLAHTGQYQCQQGCKKWFKTTKLLDEHHKFVHIDVPEVQFQCDECEQAFANKQFLNKHLRSKHGNDNEHHGLRSSCDYCGLLVRDQGELREHINNYHHQNNEQQFQQVKRKLCYFYLKDRCLKGEYCRFLHDENKKGSKQNISQCRNGASCIYLMRGGCRYSHSKIRGQEPQPKTPYKNTSGYQSNRWCMFLEDCNRVPYCEFKHYDEVFPQLPKMNTPPWQRETRWEDY